MTVTNGYSGGTKAVISKPHHPEPVAAFSTATKSGSSARSARSRAPEELDDTAHLLFFASRGDVESARAILKSGANVNASDYDGRTALHLAASEGKLEMIDLLLSVGADVNATDRWGRTPLSDALHAGYEEACRQIRAAGGKASAETGPLATPNLSPAKDSKDVFEIDVSELDFQNAETVGKGAHGEIRVVNWRGTRVAVKTILSQLSTRPQVEREFRDELMLLKKLRHPNIVQFLGAVTLTEPMMLITEYLSRGDLHDILARKGPLSADEAVHYALDIARGMNYLHQHKPEAIVHLDLKPRNLLRDEAGHLKVADFGLSRLLRTQTEDPVQESAYDARERSTYLYIAPELLHHQSYDKSVDVYSFAMIVRQMFEGVSTPSDDDPKAVAERYASENERPPLAAAHYPPGMKELITRCWNQDPKKRPAFTEIMEILEAMETKLSSERHRGRSSVSSKPGCCQCVIL